MNKAINFKYLLGLCLFLSASLYSSKSIAQFDLNFTIRNACNGPNSGSIVVTIQNNIPPGNTDFTYYWRGPNNFDDTLAITNNLGTQGGLAAGFYRIDVYRDADNAFESGTVEVRESADPLDIGLVSTTPTSCNDGDGAIDVDGIDGTPPYVYAILDGTGGPSVAGDFTGFNPNDGIYENLNQGTYNIAVRDALRCVVVLNQIDIIQANSTLAIALDDTDNASCNGANDGSIDVSATGGVGNYAYSLIQGAGAPTEQDFLDQGFQANGGLFENLAANTYHAAVQDDNGCIEIRNGIIITEPDPIVLTQEVRFTTCDSTIVDNNGRINILTTTGGSPPYTYDWVEPDGFTATGLAINNLEAGDYAVTVTDNNGCQRQFNYIIYEGYNLQAVPDNVSCTEADDGSITLNIIWDDLRDNGDPNNIPHGQPGVNLFVRWDKLEITPTDTTVIPQGDVDNDVTISNLGPGFYVATVEDHYFCIKRDTVEITEPENPLNIDDVTVVDNQCLGFSEGSIEIEASGGGSAIYRYSIDGGINYQEESLFENLASGSYNVVVLDAINGCTDNETVIVEEPATTFFIDDVATVDITCFNDPDIGEANIVISKTDPSHPITDINWYDFGATTPFLDSSQPTLIEQVDDLEEGAYTVEVIDAFGCVKTFNFQINRPEEFRFTLESENIPCPEGGDIELSATVEGGTPDYNYIWTYGVDTLLNEIKPGTTSSLSLDNTTANAGTYVLTVLDDNECQIITDFEVTIPDPIVITADPVIDNACIGGTDGLIDISVTGGTPLPGNTYKYSWEFNGNPLPNNTQDLNNLGAGDYTVFVTDANDCDPVSQTITINEPTTTFSIITEDITPVRCNGETNGSIDVTIQVDAGHPTAANQFTYTWYKDGNATPYATATRDLFDLGPGEYELVVNDNFPNTAGCEISETFTVEEYNPIVLNPQVVQNECPGEDIASITLNPVGGLVATDYTYAWERNGVTMAGETGPAITDLESGNYEVTLTDDLGCTVVQSFNIIGFTPFSIDTEDVTNVSCFGADDGEISISVSGANGTIEYLWVLNGSFFSDQATISNLAPGTYELTVADVIGGTECTVYNETYVITEPLDFDIVETVNDATCNGDDDGEISVVLQRSGAGFDETGFSFSWVDLSDNSVVATATKSISGLAAGDYRIDIIDNNGCPKSETYTVVEFSPITVNETIGQITCPGDATGFINLAPVGGDLSGDGNYDYAWTRNTVAFGGNTPNLTNLTPGTYAVTVTDDNGCGVNESFVINSIPAFSVSESESDVSCFGAEDGEIAVGITGGTGTINYTWLKDGNLFSNQSTIDNLEPGTYELTANDANTCQAYTQTYTITQPQELELVETITNVTCNGDSDGEIEVILRRGGTPIPGNTFTWTRLSDGVNFANNVTTVSGLSAGMYRLVATDATGCSIEETYNVIEFSEIQINPTITQLECPGTSTASIEVGPVGGDLSGDGLYEFAWERNGTPLAGETSNLLENRNAGTYEVFVTDDNGCTVSAQYVINSIPAFNIIDNVNQITCHGETDGAIDLEITGGTGTLSYQWIYEDNIFANVPDISGLEAGDYEITVTDENGCVALNTTYTINEPPTITINADITDVTCDQVSDGIIDITISDVPAGFDANNFTYTWTRLADNVVVEPNGQDISGLASGLYRLDVTHPSFSPGITSNCVISREYQVINFEPIEIEPTVVQNTCPGVNEGSISIDIQGGSVATDYDIDWFRNDTNPYAFDVTTINNLAAGKYTAIVSDDIGCSTEISINILPIDNFVANIDANDVSCIGEADGSIEVDLTGGLTGNFRYNWIFNGTTQLPDQPNQENLAPGTYELSIDALDANGDPICDVFDLLDGNSTRTFEIEEPNLKFIIADNITDVRCNGESNGSIAVHFEDNVGNPISSNQFDKQWFLVNDDNSLTELTGATGSTLSNRPAGEYLIRITENAPTSNNCVFENTFTIQDYDELSIDNIITSQLSCDGATDGSIRLEVSGGNAPTDDDYIVEWTLNGAPFVDTDLATNLEISNLASGTYKAVITDLSGCSITENEVIVEHQPITIANFEVTQISCFNTAADGSITIEVSGGTAPYSFDWSKDGVGNFSSNQNLTGLEPGTYAVTIDDDNECPGGAITSQDFIIEEPPSYVIDAVVDNETCLGDEGGSIDITINVTPDGALNPSLFDYTWFYEGVEITAFKDQRDIDGLTAGTYRLDVVDNTDGACAVSREFTLVAYEGLQLNADVEQITCPGESDGSITIDPIGGSPNGPLTIEWYQNDVLLVDSTGTSIRGLEPDAYQVIVTDAEGCATNQRFTIIDLPDISVPTENVTVTQIRCEGETNGSIAVNIEGGNPPYNVLWRRNGQFFTEILNVADADTAEVTIDSLQAGDYTILINDQNDCPSFSATYTINELTTTFNGGIARPQPIVCHDASNGILSAVILPEAGHPDDNFEVEWYKDDDDAPFSTETTVEQLGPGDYRLEVTDELGCKKFAEITLTNPDPISFNASVNPLICNGASDAIIQLDPSGGWGSFRAEWREASRGALNNTGFRLTNASAGEYRISLFDSVGCRADTTIFIQDPIRMVAIPTVTNVACQGNNTGVIDLAVSEGTPPYKFEWRRDTTLISLEQNIENLIAGTYAVRIEDSNGCIIEVNDIELTEPELSFSIEAEIDRVTCHNGSDGGIFPEIIEEGGTSTYIFNWYQDSTLIAQDTRNLQGISGGEYVLEVIEANGCSKTRTFNLINPFPLTTNEVVEDLSCFGSLDGSIAVQARGGYGNYTYEWSKSGQILPDTTGRLTNLDIGIYRCVITDEEGCDIIRRFEVREPLPILIDYDFEHNTCPTNFDAFISASVTGGRPPYSFLWQRNGDPVSNDLSIDSLPPADYVLTVVDSSLCEVTSDTITITAPEPLEFNVLSFKDNLCPSTENGAFSVQGRGGTGPYLFTFDSSAFSNRNDFFGLGKGEYLLEIQDDRGCVSDTLIEINNQYELEADFNYDFQELAIDYTIDFEDQSIGPGIVRWFWDFGDERADANQNPSVIYEAVGEYIVELTVENEVQCTSTKRDTLNIEQGYVFTIPTGFSPNNDGLNDFFRPVFDNIIDIETRIMDRNGQIVFIGENREEFWDGTFNGKRAPQAPYYYEIVYTSRAGKTRSAKGKVLLLR